MSQHEPSPRLLRTIGLTTLVIYGVGDMVGSGIYATVGKAAGQMGNAVWLSFVVSMVAAVLTGLSYACLSSRYPRAAGAAYITQRAFRMGMLSYVIGLAVAASGLTSMATSTNAFANAATQLSGWPWWVWALGFLGFMTWINLRGIRQSMWTNILCTAVEVGGLLFIIAIGARYWGSVDYLETPLATFDDAGAMLTTGLAPGMVLAGAVLTFFSFIGFEDMLNVAEEVKNPRVTMPWGIVLAVGAAAALYIAVAVTAVSVTSYRELASHDAPLAAITQKAAPWLPHSTFVYITLFAVANTVLINYIMASRLLYGMAKQGLMPGILGRIHPRWRTPHIAILTLLLVALALTFVGGVAELAKATGLLLLCVFMVVNAALVVLKLRPGESRGAFEVPVMVPVLGIIVSGALVLAQVRQSDMRPQIIAGGLLALILILYMVMRPKTITEEALAEAEHAE